MQYVTRHGGATRKDMDPVRQKAFRDSGADAEKYFAKYGNDRITLQILGTHPDHWRRGYATSLCRYGMRIAAEDGLAVTLVAGQTGLGLYRHLNFTSLSILVKQVPGEKERVISEAMVYDLRDQAVSSL
jgi:ribosomal protein S18 acetylase RimI-like enzyme